MRLLAWPGIAGSLRGPFLLLCAPVLWAFIAVIHGPQPQTMANIPELPGLAFDQYLVDLREVAPTEEIFANFEFRNTSQHTVNITSLVPSCGCMQPQLKKTTYEPGESGYFLLRIKTALQQPGPKEFNVKVNYTDTQPRSRVVYLRATFPTQQIYVRPMSLTFHQLGTSEVYQEIIVTDLRKSPAEIIGVESSSDFVNVEVLPASTTKTGARKQHIRVTVPGAVPAGRQMGTIKIFTNDDRFHEMKVPIQVFGPERQTSHLRFAGPQPQGTVRR